MAAVTAAILQRVVSCEQGCCLRGGQLLQTKSSNIEEAVSELMSMLLVHPTTEEGNHLALLLLLASTIGRRYYCFQLCVSV